MMRLTLKTIFFFLSFFSIAIFAFPTNNFADGSIDKEKRNPGDSVTIVAFGNSITAIRKTVHKVFAQRIPDLLLEKGIRARVINSGIPGSHTGRQSDHGLFKIRHALERFESDVLAHNPDLVIIGFGTNDAHIDSKLPDGDSRIPLNKYKSNIEYMINQLLGRNIKVILIAPNILGANHGDLQNDRLLQYVKVVRKLSKKYRLGLVDNYKLFINFQKKSGKSYDTLMLDGVHPNDLGHELIANRMAQEIFKTLK
jgi:lysophospholipase L1-like esterase